MKKLKPPSPRKTQWKIVNVFNSGIATSGTIPERKGNLSKSLENAIPGEISHDFCTSGMKCVLLPQMIPQQNARFISSGSQGHWQQEVQFQLHFVCNRFPQVSFQHCCIVLGMTRFDWFLCGPKVAPKSNAKAKS